MTRKKEIDRDAILDAAEAVVVELGAHRLTLDLVAARTGISKGGLAYNFKTKDDLVTAIVNREIGRFRAEMERRKPEFADHPHPDLLARIAVTRGENEMMISKAASALVAFLLSEKQRKPMQAGYRGEMSAFDISTAQGKRALVEFLALEGIFLLRGLQFIELTEADWQNYLDIIRDAYLACHDVE